MELSRRDALAALSAGGAAVGAGVGAAVLGDRPADGPARDGAGSGGTAADATPTDRADGLGAHERATLTAIARIVYPSDVTGIDAFVGAYLDGRAGDDAYAAGATAAVGTLDDLGREWHGGRFLALDPPDRETLLREVGADTADPDPDGSPAERVRYYLVNELLYALYASPTGGRLVGIENPQGHPGGTASYQRGPGA